MDFDYSWNALTEPGESTCFFDIDNPIDFDNETEEYHAFNAWVLAELSRLVYKENLAASSSSSLPSPRTRAHFAKKANLIEKWTLTAEGLFCAYFVPPPDSGTKYGILAFRGTHEIRNWVSNLNAIPAPWPTGGVVHNGYRKALGRIWIEIEQALSQIRYPLFYTGHSFGGALAVLAASRRPPHAVYTFGSPRVGNTEFSDSLGRTRIYRVVNCRDIVPKLPPAGGPLDFCHAGEQHLLTPIRQSRNTKGLIDSTDDRNTTKIAKYLTMQVPPPPMANHAPVNYVAHLERQFLGCEGV